MINSNELRLGNLVQRRDEVVEVTGVDREDVFVRAGGEYGDYERWYFENVDPIPLTPEWLHKFGVTWNNINGSEYYFTTTGLDGLRLDPPTKGEDDGWTPMTPDGDGSIGKEIFFVHQLQNLFYSLTGEELTIKEPT